MHTYMQNSFLSHKQLMTVSYCEVYSLCYCQHSSAAEGFTMSSYTEDVQPVFFDSRLWQAGAVSRVRGCCVKHEELSCQREMCHSSGKWTGQGQVCIYNGKAHLGEVKANVNIHRSNNACDICARKWSALNLPHTGGMLKPVRPHKDTKLLFVLYYKMSLQS